MDIHQAIQYLLKNTEEIKKHYTTVVEVRHAIKDIPLDDLKKFAIQQNHTIHTDRLESRAYIIHSPLVNGKMDSDIWLYSTVVNIKPAEITEL
jgi:hypothetical protein